MRKSRKNPRTVQVIRLRDAQGQTCFCAPLRDFSPPEEEVLRLSMEFYGDPAPCLIHRGAVLSRVQAEILACLGDGEEKPLELLPEAYRPYFSAYPGVQTVQVVEGQA